MERRLLTTGEVAEICSVARDTVFKWIRAGHLPACRTAGGHHRVDRSDLDQFLKRSDSLDRGEPTQASTTQGRYCWEHHGQGTLLEGCRRCGVYLMRARRCYEWRRAVGDVGQPGIFCNESCADCDYYGAVHAQNTNVLVLSNDTDLISDLTENAAAAGFNLRVAECGYDCSTLVSQFRPDYVIIDCCVRQEEAKSVAQRLLRDPRIPFVRLVLAGDQGEFPAECDKGFLGRIARPFRVQDISEFIGAAVWRSQREDVRTRKNL